MAKKADLLEEAKAKGIVIPDSKTIPEIKRILAEAAPTEPDLDAADATIPGDAENAPAAVQELAALDDPHAPLPHTPAEALSEYAELGKPIDDDVKVDVSGENPPPVEVARGPLPASPPDGWRPDYSGPAQVVGPSQPVNTDPHQQGGADTQPDEPNADREHAQETANAPGAGLGVQPADGSDRPEDGGAGKAAPERKDEAPVRVKDGV